MERSRRFLLGLAGIGFATFSLGRFSTFASAQTGSPTPACDDGDEPAPALTEGPYFTPGSPQRGSLLEPGMAGTQIVLTGYVLSRSCRPIPGVLVDLWHADDAGNYDNEGFRFRGHQFTDDDGLYRFETIVPGIYPGRTRHFHVKYQAPNQPVLTTQLYFPGESDNQRDRLFRSELLLSITDAPVRTGRFDAVLDLA
jgi:protocatechuate 3,4-dioxygenase beta subunit